jgi:hypothetical protein
MSPMRKAILPLAAGVAVLSLYLGAQEPDKVPPPFEKAAGDDGSGLDPFAETFINTPELPKMIQVQVEYVELAHETLTDLLFLADPPSADATPLRKQVQELVKKGEAKVIETMILDARSGEKALTESINEFIYPTEYEPPTLPGTFGSSNRADDLSLDDIKILENLFNFATPTSFETRNLGNTLEIEPLIGGGDQYIDLRLAPDMVWHTGETVWVERRDSLGNIAKIQMPKIYSMRITTALTCKEGQYVLAAVQSPKDAEGTTDLSRKVMVFVKCDILVVK